METKAEKLEGGSGACRNLKETPKENFIAKMLRIVDPQAQGTAPAGIPKFNFYKLSPIESESKNNFLPFG